MNDLKGILYWIVILLALWLLWPLIKGLIFIVLVAAIVIFVLAYLKNNTKDDKVIDVEVKVKDRNDKDMH